MEDNLRSGFYKSLLGHNNVDWFLNVVTKLENKMAFCLKNTKKDIIMTEKDEEDFRNNNICRFCEKYKECDKVRDHCHLTGKYRGPAHSKCNCNFTQGQSNFIPFFFTISVIMIVICSLKKVVDKKNVKVNSDIIPKTNEEYLSVSYGCIRFINSYDFYQVAWIL